MAAASPPKRIIVRRRPPRMWLATSTGSLGGGAPTEAHNEKPNSFMSEIRLLALSALSETIQDLSRIFLHCLERRFLRQLLQFLLGVQR